MMNPAEEEAAAQEHQLTISPPRTFPFCIVWTPIPLITWVFPFIGHMGALSRVRGHWPELLQTRSWHMLDFSFTCVQACAHLRASSTTLLALVSREATWRSATPPSTCPCGPRLPLLCCTPKAASPMAGTVR